MQKQKTLKEYFIEIGYSEEYASEIENSDFKGGIREIIKYVKNNLNDETHDYISEVIEDYRYWQKYCVTGRNTDFI